MFGCLCMMCVCVGVFVQDGLLVAMVIIVLTAAACAFVSGPLFLFSFWVYLW